MKKIMQLLFISLLLSGCSFSMNENESVINEATGTPFNEDDLYLASCYGELEMAKAVLALDYVDLIDKSLLCAIDNNEGEIVELLLEYSPDLTWQNEEGENYLLYAIHKKSYSSIDPLLYAGVDPYQVNVEGSNVLDYLLNPILDENGELEQAHMLFSTLTTLQDLNVNIHDMKIFKDFSTELVEPLLYSIYQKSAIAVHALLNAGFSYEIRNEEDAKIADDLTFMAGASTSKRYLATLCIVNTYEHVPAIQMPLGAWPTCQELFEMYYDTYQIQAPLGDGKLYYRSNYEEVDVDESDEVEVEENNLTEMQKNYTDSDKLEGFARQIYLADLDETTFPYRAEEALVILQANYPDYELVGSATFVLYEHNENSGWNEPAYLYPFIKDGISYIGALFEDGSVHMRLNEE